ncbi:hypothetical protein [Streptomyces sp. NPDC001741]|uniref:hypothetical protein n=1 Tax=Streptomyces sp. NPDC001741 TaxID=3364605 RepID=UPI0036AD7F8A
MSALEELRTLLDAVADAIDVPYPDSFDDDEAYRSLLDRRARIAVVVARAALAEEPDAYGWNAAYLRRKIEQHPVTYGAGKKPEVAP